MVVDIHTHVLPKVDDGSQSIDESLAMLDLMAKDGVTDIVFTPHFYYRNQHISNYLEKRKNAYDLLQSKYSGNIQFHLGAETEFPFLKIDYKVFQELGIDGGKYILLELPFDAKNINSIISKIVQFIYDSDMIPIIAHVERYLFIQKDPGSVADLINAGCLIQVNADSVIRSKKGSLVDALFKHDQIHLLGSDCHHTEERVPCLKKALDVVCASYGKAYVSALMNVSEAVINQKRTVMSTEDRIHKVFGSYK